MEHRDVFQRELTHEFDAVYIIESLADGELRTGRTLYDDVVAPVASYHRLHARLLIASSKSDLLSHLQSIKAEVEQNNLSPILHFDAHGSRKGLGLADGSSIRWDEIRDVLAEINMVSRFNLLVVLAACSGIYLQDVVRPDRPAPLWGLIGPTKMVSAGEIETRFQRFYWEYLETLDPKRAMEALNDAPLGTAWTYGFRSAANLFREAWRGYALGFLDPAVADERFKRFADASPGLTNVDESSKRLMIRAVLVEHKFFLDRFASRFFMYDLFPENSTRFPVDAELLYRELMEEWQDS